MIVNRKVTSPHCAASGQRGDSRAAPRGVSEKGQQAGGAGPPSGAETG